MRRVLQELFLASYLGPPNDSNDTTDQLLTNVPRERDNGQRVTVESGLDGLQHLDGLAQRNHTFSTIINQEK